MGGAITGVVVGIAAQQTLGNFFAGLVLLFARPYVPGQRVPVTSGAMGVSRQLKPGKSNHPSPTRAPAAVEYV